MNLGAGRHAVGEPAAAVAGDMKKFEPLLLLPIGFGGLFPTSRKVAWR